MRVIKFLSVAIVVVILSLVIISMIPMFVNTNYVKDGAFVSPQGNFSFTVPASMSLGGKRTDSRHSVSFTNDWCELYRVDYGEIPEEEVPLLSDVGREKFQEHFLRNVYINIFLQPRMPDGKITIDFVDYDEKLHGGGLYAQLDTPNGSVCEVRENSGTPTRNDAKRALLILMKGKQIYVVSSALAVHHTGVDGMPSSTGLAMKSWSQPLREMLKSQTVEFAKTIQFME